MRLSKSQAFVITALNVVIVILLVLLFWSPLGTSSAFGGNSGSGGGGGDDTKPTGGEVKHEKLRNAIAGAVPEVVRETRLMGNGDETVVSVYFRDGVSYIFGNATVKGLDFDDYGGFLCIVNAAGSIMSFTYFDGAIGAIGVAGMGYAVGAGEKLYFVDYLGKATVVSEIKGKAVDIFAGSLDANKIAVVTQPSANEFRCVEYKMNGENFTAGNSTLIYSYRNLEYFAGYGYDGEYVIAARASTLPRYDSLAFFSFVPGGNATEHYDTDDKVITTPYAVMPSENGYVSLCSRNGSAAIVKLGAAFAAYPAIDLSFETSGAKLFMSGEKYYACFSRADGAVTYELTDDHHFVLSALDGITVDSMINAGGMTAVGKKSESEAVVAKFSGGELSLAIDDVVIYGGFKNGDYTTLVLYAVGGEEISKPTAGRDISVVTVKI